MWWSPLLSRIRKERQWVSELTERWQNGNADWLLNRYAAAIVANNAYFARTLEVIDAMTLDAILN
jgi:hypothetical protein